jgi:peroxiredoxin
MRSLKFLSIALLVTVLLAPALIKANADPMPVTVRPAPPLAPGEWVNGAPTTIAAQKGKVVVLLFWTYECINCEHNLGFWNDWAKEYKNSDVSVISVHTPELPAERVHANVRAFCANRGLVFPVITDNGAETWRAYGIEYWPSEVLIDKEGRIRYIFGGELNWQGSGEYKTVHRLIEELRHETSPATSG